jgi:membrane protein implicated in regulation of membrane protease activity
MNWWGWVVGGVIMLGAELGFVDAQFYLVFLGSAAILVGLATATIPNLSLSAQWAGFAVFGVVSMLAFRKPIYQRVRGHAPEVSTGPAGTLLTLQTSLAPGESCQVEHGGSHWTAQNEGDAPIPAGTRVRVAQVRGLTLVVRPDL